MLLFVVLEIDYSNGRMRICQSWSGFRARVARLAKLTALPLLVAGWIVFAVSLAQAEKVEQLSPQGYVNDFAGVLDTATQQKLTTLCQELDTKADAQVAVVTIHTLEGDTAQDFANRLFQKWGVGPKGKDRGVMFLLAVDDHQYWTEVGYGLEPILPDGKVGGFGRGIVPLLRQNQYSGAVLQMASQIASVIAEDRGVALNAQPPQAGGEEGPSIFGLPPFLVFLLFLLIVFGGLRILVFILTAFGLIRYRRGRGYPGRYWMGPMGGWMGGGYGGGGWGGGGGFGGFGGGMSGGGGAGGSW